MLSPPRVTKCALSLPLPPLLAVFSQSVVGLSALLISTLVVVPHGRGVALRRLRYWGLGTEHPDEPLVGLPIGFTFGG